MNNTNLHIYESLVDAYNSGNFWYFYEYVSEDIRFSTVDNIKFEGKGTFKTYFSHISHEMVKNNTHSIASLGQLKKNRNSLNLNKLSQFSIPSSNNTDNESSPNDEFIVLLRNNRFTKPKYIILFKFNDKNLIVGMDINHSYDYDYVEIKNNNSLSYVQLTELAIDEAEKLYKSQGFTVERTEMEVHTLPHLRIYGTDEYYLNVFLLVDNYPFSGHTDENIENYLVFTGNIDFLHTKIVSIQVEGKGEKRHEILKNDRYSISVEKTKEFSLGSHFLDAVEL
jgi:hypothetical protein